MMTVGRRLSVPALAALTLALAACGGESTPADPSTSSVAESSETETTVSPSASETEGDEPASSPGTDVEGDGAAPDGAGSGTLSDPYAPGAPLVIYNIDGSGETSLAEVIVGPANWNANGLVETATEEGASAPAGSSYVLVPVTVTLQESDSQAATRPDYLFDITYVSPDGRSFSPVTAGIPDALSSQPELYPGANATGNVLFELPDDATGGVWGLRDWLQTYDPAFVTAS